ncbi:lipase (plasmid) [Fulvitalea axinellae]|uniref:Lipase n=1 Tax=Fulvitalea axinellae TaxID=1182444 RepID=A0AAU9CIF0_9BACT|nr:lipase [Fulvitalea axinellae]
MGNRRDFLKKSIAGSGAVALLSGTFSSCSSPEAKAPSFGNGDVILFQGDSITDAGRQRNIDQPNHQPALGHGYAQYAGVDLLCEHADKKLKVYNRGISGNKVYQLNDRWDKDCLSLKPNVLSILIGVNDYWHKRAGKYDASAEVYQNDYRALLQRTVKALPNIKLVLCEPFILPNTRAVDESWIEPFKVYQKAAKSLSEEFGTVWVPYQEVFNKALDSAPEAYWLPDGVHPSMAGAKLMADAWVKAVK